MDSRSDSRKAGKRGNLAPKAAVTINRFIPDRKYDTSARADWSPGALLQPRVGERSEDTAAVG